MKQNLLLLLIILLLSGCGFVIADLNLFRSGNSISKPPKEQIVNFQKAKVYIGKTKNEILEEFGLNIKYSEKNTLAISDYPIKNDNLHPMLLENLNNTSGLTSYYTVDEVGYYRFDAGIPVIMPNQYSIYFYFIDNICVYVSGS